MSSTAVEPVAPPDETTYYSAEGPDALPPLARTERLVSLDALRGFDMFWILGADALVHSIARVAPNNKVASTLGVQMEHAPWEGFHFYDLIFPMFVFIVGVSIVFSLTKAIARDGTGAALKRIIVRSIWLYLFGVLLYKGLSVPWPGQRLLGVLQRIALCYLVAAILFTYLRPRTLAIIAASLLVLYWGLLALVKVPGVGRGVYEEGKNLTNYVDSRWLPAWKWEDKPWDPEGLLSTLPAIAGCLAGVLVGVFMKDDRIRPARKFGTLLLLGAAGIAAGMAWGGMIPTGKVQVPALLVKLKFPVIKKIWTSSFVLLATGWSMVLFAVFYLVTDIWRLRLWARPFLWIGMNAITLYVIVHLVSFRDKLAKPFVGDGFASAIQGIGDWHWVQGIARGRIASALRNYDPAVLVAALALFFVLLLARFMYRRQIFLRL
jgi:predicted acyltransferase